MRKLLLVLVLFGVCSCENLSFSNINSSTRENVINNTSDETTQSNANSITQSSDIIKDLEYFEKAINNQLKEDYQYHIYSCYDGLTYKEDKVLQNINDNLWYKEDDVIYHLTANKLHAYTYVDELGYIHYEDEIDYKIFDHSSWIERFIVNILDSEINIEDNKISKGQYYISSYNESIEGRISKTIYVEPKSVGSNKYYKINIFTNKISNLLEIKNNYISAEDYVSLMLNEANKITLSHEYKLLDKINGYLDDSYYHNPGFGVDAYSDKKYGFEDFRNAINEEKELVYFEVTSYPDCGYSNGTYITSFTISDKEITFNGLTLNSSIIDIVNHFVNELGYKHTINKNSVYENHYFSKYGIIIMLTTKDNVVSVISFNTVTSNVFNIIY